MTTLQKDVRRAHQIHVSAFVPRISPAQSPLPPGHSAVLPELPAEQGVCKQSLLENKRCAPGSPPSVGSLNGWTTSYSQGSYRLFLMLCLWRWHGIPRVPTRSEGPQDAPDLVTGSEEEYTVKMATSAAPRVLWMETSLPLPPSGVSEPKSCDAGGRRRAGGGAAMFSVPGLGNARGRSLYAATEEAGRRAVPRDRYLTHGLPFFYRS